MAKFNRKDYERVAKIIGTVCNERVHVLGDLIKEFTTYFEEA